MEKAWTADFTESSEVCRHFGQPLLKANTWGCTVSKTALALHAFFMNARKQAKNKTKQKTADYILKHETHKNKPLTFVLPSVFLSGCLTTAGLKMHLLPSEAPHF